jgi:exo-1,4-beta-D-glucosaminidase
LFRRSTRIDILPDSSTRVFTLRDINARVYFVNLALHDAMGSLVSSNFYWLSAQPDVFDWKKSTWYYTPLVTYADFTALQTLPKVRLDVTTRTHHKNGRASTEVTLYNPSPHLAFFVRLSVHKGPEGDEVLPVLWSDNYVTLLPGTHTRLQASYRSSDLHGARPAVHVSGWNILDSRHRQANRGTQLAK